MIIEDLTITRNMIIEDLTLTRDPYTLTRDHFTRCRCGIADLLRIHFEFFAANITCAMHYPFDAN